MVSPPDLYKPTTHLNIPLTATDHPTLQLLWSCQSQHVNNASHTLKHTAKQKQKQKKTNKNKKPTKTKNKQKQNKQTAVFTYFCPYNKNIEQTDSRIYILLPL